jgi:hypothetical protein
LTAALLLAIVVVPAAAKGPKCADLQSTDADGTHLSRASYDGPNHVVNGLFYLAAKSCKNVTYTLIILDNDGDTTPIAQASVLGDGTSASVAITVENVVTTDGDACAYVTVSRGKSDLDRAPADGCVVLLDDGSSPGGGKGF